MATDTRYDRQKDPETLEREIDEVRSEMGRTLEALEEKFSPGRLLDYYLGMAREHGGEFAKNLGISVKQNPVPMMLTAIGLGWTMIAANREPYAGGYRKSYMYDDTGYDEMGDTPSTTEKIKAGAESARDRLVGSKDALRDKIVSSKDAVRDRITGTARSTQAQARRAREGFGSLVEEQRLILGALGIALGAALGAMLPRTEQEDRLIGQARDKAVAKVKERATELYEHARETVKETAEQGRQTLSNQNDAPVHTTGPAA
jgi:ElaB/YqjD/DUF883 family membrane-anchored ribosome-binding protein